MYRVAASSQATLRRFYTTTPLTRQRVLAIASPLTTGRAFQRTVPTITRTAATITRSIRTAPVFTATTRTPLTAQAVRIQPSGFVKTKRVPDGFFRRKFTTETEAAAAAEEEVGTLTMYQLCAVRYDRLKESFNDCSRISFTLFA